LVITFIIRVIVLSEIKGLLVYFTFIKY
jgi:hypothetical protein